MESSPVVRRSAAAAGAAAVVACLFVWTAAVGGAQGAALPLEDGVCGAGHAMCYDGSGCVPLEQLCDGTPDCGDETDEINCEERRAELAAVVAAKEASEAAGLAEGAAAGSGEGAGEESAEGKAGGSAEEARVGLAQGECADDEHRCLDGTCISKARLCDASRDCVDGSDEDALAGCSGNSTWVPAENGLETELLVGSHGGPPMMRVGRSCRKDEFTCSDGTCISINKTCDQHADCPDGGDELLACPTPANGSCHDGFQCVADKLCIPLEWVCDERSECRDGSDEDKLLCSTWVPPTRPPPGPSTPPPPPGKGHDGDIIDGVAEANGRKNPYEEKMVGVEGDRCAEMEPAEKILCREVQLQNVKAKEAALRRSAAEQLLEGARADAAAAKALSERRMQTAELQRQAAEDLLEQQQHLFELRVQALSQTGEKKSSSEQLTRIEDMDEHIGENMMAR